MMNLYSISKRILPLFIVCATYFVGQAQDEAVHTQYFINMAWVNPGYTGFNDQHNIYANFRSHWSSFKGAPRNYSLQYHGAVTDRIGIGAQLGNEEIGVTDRLRASLSYSYRFGSDDWKMGIGLTTQFESFSISGNVNTNPNIDPNDPLIIEATDGTQYFNLHVGFYGEYQESFLFGVSLPDVLHVRVDEGFGTNDAETFDNFMAFLGYRFGFEDYDIKVEPSIMMKRLPTVDFAFDANLRLSFLDEQLIGGVTYSTGTGDRLGFLIGTQLTSFRLYYSYDVSFRDLQDFSNGSHDITIGFTWPRRTAE